jgi:hypothetical protein
MMGTMNTTARTNLRSTTRSSAEQLTLLPTSSTPARFRLSRQTRELGLRHIAEIRQMLASSAEGAPSITLASRSDQAA